jgi:hypothetical protein
MRGAESRLFGHSLYTTYLLRKLVYIFDIQKTVDNSEYSVFPLGLSGAWNIYTLDIFLLIFGIVTYLSSCVEFFRFKNKLRAFYELALPR